MRRPSARETISSSSDVTTAVASGTTSTSETLIPCLNEFIAMFSYEPGYGPKLVRRKTTRLCQRWTSEPELREHVVPLNMHVTRLPTIAAEEEEPVWPQPSNRWHCEVEYTPLVRNMREPTRIVVCRSRGQGT